MGLKTYNVVVEGKAAVVSSQGRLYVHCEPHAVSFSLTSYVLTCAIANTEGMDVKKGGAVKCRGAARFENGFAQMSPMGEGRSLLYIRLARQCSC